jgi:hypothetical protein
MSTSGVVGTHHEIVASWQRRRGVRPPAAGGASHCACGAVGVGNDTEIAGHASAEHLLSGTYEFCLLDTLRQGP